MKNWRLYFSLAVFSGMLPVVMWGVVNGQPNKLVSKADQPTELRVWFEPAEIKLNVGQTANIEVMAGYNDSNKIIPKLDMNISNDEGIKVGSTNVIYKYPFSGEISVGKISVYAKQPGKYKLKVNDEAINTGLTNLPAITFPATVIVEP